MGLYKHLKETWNENPRELVKSRLAEWRREPSVNRVERPTRLDRARSVGYKAKKGFLIVRVRLLRGGRRRPMLRSGRKSSTSRRLKILSMNYQRVAEQRANNKFLNCEVLNSYFIAKDGLHYWYEVVLADREQCSKYAGYEWLANPSQRGRVFRGKTIAGRRARGLLWRGKGAEKARPSKTARFKYKYSLKRRRFGH